MPNIPTDLLRTFITVVDQKSFTRAARVLGVTQPGVSAHIKRLQTLLRCELFDRSGSAFSLTAKGQMVLGYARRMLSVNDMILTLVEPGNGARTIRLGVPIDFVGGQLPATLADIRKRRPDLCFTLQHGSLDSHLADLQEGDLDLVVGLSLAEPALDARHQWTERMVWLRGRATRLDPSAPVPLVAMSESCTYYRAAVDVLRRTGRGSELVFLGPTIVSLAAAVDAGLGVAALPRSRVWSSEMTVWEHPPLPTLPDLTWGIYLREDAEVGPLEDLADAIAARLRARSVAAARATRGQRGASVTARRIAASA
jgi:DNA-binding transcriptional LysR family regulator